MAKLTFLYVEKRGVSIILDFIKALAVYEKKLAE